MAVKIKWEVNPAPTGRFRSFQRRGWPVGMLTTNQRVLLSCEDDYVPAKVKAGDHRPIKISVDIANPLTGATSLVDLKKQAATMTDAKAIAADFFDRNPQYIKATK